MSGKKLIYLLNSYKKNESSHFFHVLNLLSALAQRGVEIILLIEKADDVPKFKEANITVITLKNRRGLKRFLELFRTISNLNDKGFKRTYIRISSMSAVVASLSNKLKGGRTYFWQSGTTIEWDLAQPFTIKKLKWYFTSYYVGRLARFLVDCFVTGPESMGTYYEKVAGVNRKKIRILYNDIDLKRFGCSEEERIHFKKNLLAENNFPLDSLVLLLVHRLSPVRKTWMYFPTSLSTVDKEFYSKNIVVVVAGAGEDLEQIKRESIDNALADKILFLGDIPNHQIQMLYKASDVFLHPTYNEGFPRVVLEAMAAGLPIVSTDAGGTKELLGPKQQAYISDKNDSNAFSDNLNRILLNETDRNELSQENLNYVGRFSTEKIAKMYEEVLFD